MPAMPSRFSCAPALAVAMAIQVALPAGQACINHAGPYPFGKPRVPPPVIALDPLKPVFDHRDLPSVVPPTLLEFGTSLSPSNARQEPEFGRVAALHADFVKFVREFETQREESPDFSAVINYSAALIRTGGYAKAIKALLELEQKHPGAYQTATNLGTAYELSGELEDAALWIARGIERNAASHHGTEWLHLAILRTKLRLRAEPDWLTRHSVLDGIDDRSPDEVVRAIEVQLAERLQFVRPKDEVVSDLFFQAALRVQATRGAEGQAHFLRESLRFGDVHRPEAERRLKAFADRKVRS
jgi:tetratricopeptide (TPR) repeat protein